MNERRKHRIFLSAYNVRSRTTHTYYLSAHVAVLQCREKNQPTNRLLTQPPSSRGARHTWHQNRQPCASGYSSRGRGNESWPAQYCCVWLSDWTRFRCTL